MSVHAPATSFDDRLRRYGLTRADLKYREVRVGGDKGHVFSHDPAESDFDPIVLRTPRLDDLKRWLGNPDALFERGLLDPADYERPEIRAGRHLGLDLSSDRLTAGKTALLIDVARAYVHGHSVRYASYKAAIERHLGPFRVAVLAGENLVILPGKPFTVPPGPPKVLAFDTITYAGSAAQFVSYAPVKVDAAKLIMQ